MHVVLPLCYLPPVSWFALAARYPQVYVETGQHYRKQTYANRAFVRAGHGLLQLTVPVERRDGMHIPLSEKKLVFASDWAGHHYKSLQTAYNKSPFFEHYAHRLQPLLCSGEPMLAAHALRLTQWMATAMGLETELIPTGAWLESPEQDFREAFGNSPDTLPPGIMPVPYTQVFPGFVPNLSALDLLFCCGPGSLRVLRGASPPGPLSQFTA
jgi:hypothetical protein